MPNAKQNGTPSPHNSDSMPAYGVALEALREALMAMPDAQVQREVRLDASVAADVAEAGASKLVAYRAALVAQFGADAGTLVDELPIVARAAKQADIELTRAYPSGDVSVMHKEVSTAYELLMTDAQSLANRKLIDARNLEPARDIRGYQAILRSVLVLVSLLREAWPRIAAHTPLTTADIDAAERVAQQMTTALARRDHGVNRVPAAELRARALSLLIDRYDEARRMMTFLRWHQDDADSIVPSLWAARGRGKSRNDAAVVTDDPSTPAPVVSDGPNAPAPTPAADPVAPGGPFTS